MYSLFEFTGTPRAAFTVDENTGELSGLLKSVRTYPNREGELVESVCGIVVHYHRKDAAGVADACIPGVRLLIRGRIIGDEKGNPTIYTLPDGKKAAYYDVEAAAIIPVGQHIDHNSNDPEIRYADSMYLILVGNLGRDPELRYGPSGDAVCSFSMAVNHTYKENGETIKQTVWWRISVWGKTAENAAKFLHKGSKVLVEGYPIVENGGCRIWQDRDGEDRASFEISALNFKMLDSKSESAGAMPNQTGENLGQDEEVIPF